MVMVHTCGNTNSQFSKLAHNKRHNLAKEILNNMPKFPKQALKDSL